MVADAEFDRIVSWLDQQQDATDVDSIHAVAQQTALADVLRELQDEDDVPNDLCERGVNILMREYVTTKCSTGLETDIDWESRHQETSQNSASDGEELPEKWEKRIQKWNDRVRRLDEWKVRYPNGLDPGVYSIRCTRETRSGAREYVNKTFADTDIDIFGIDFSERKHGFTRVKFNLNEPCSVEKLPERLRISTL